MKRYLISFIIVLLVLGSFAGLATFNSSASPGNQPLVETQTYWINQTSNIAVTPGMDDIPLFAVFQATNASMNGLAVNMSIGLNYNGTGPLNESYVNGPNRVVADYENYIYHAGNDYVAYQMVNVSAAYRAGIYTEYLDYAIFNATTGKLVNGGIIPFQVDIPGTIDLEISTVYFSYGSGIVEPEPGLHNTVMHIVLENAGTGSILNASLSYVPEYPFNGSSYILNVPGIASLGLLNLSVPVNISSTASHGSYVIDLNVSYGGTVHPVSHTVEIKGYNSIMVVQYHTNPLIIYEGQKYVQLNAEILNNGTSPLTDESVSLNGNFMILAGNFTLPLLMPGSVINMTFYFDSPYTSGMIHPVLKIGGFSYITSLEIHRGAIIHVTSSSFTFSPGQSKAVMEFDFTNTGNRTAYDIQIHLLSPSILSIHVSSSNPLGALTANNITIGSLAPGSSFLITFIVDISGSSGTGSYAAQIAYSFMYNDSAQRFNHFYNFNFNIAPTELQNIQTSVNPSNVIFDGVIIALLILILAGLMVAAKKKGKNGSKGKK